ncbi:MAG: hypothetical protein ACJ72N_27250 [Labedaea sp.]
MTELDALLERLGRQRFLFHQFQGDQHGPEVLAAVYDWGGVADVVILYDQRVACGYRLPTGPDTDIFAPRLVYYWFMDCPVWTLRAILTLAAPGHPDAPAELLELPAGYGLPIERRLPVRVRMRER